MLGLHGSGERMKTGILLGLIGFALTAAPVLANRHELRIPLHDGKLELADLSAAACEGIHLPPVEVGGSINLRTWRGSFFLAALNVSCGEGMNVTVSDDALNFHVDPDKLPQSVEQSKQTLRMFVAAENPGATIAQARRFGLFLPPTVDPSKRLAILIHGLDCDVSMLHSMGTMLQERGVQVAYFSYPSDQPVQDDVNMFEERLGSVREA
jgi:hypothetical protein